MDVQRPPDRHRRPLCREQAEREELVRAEAARAEAERATATIARLQAVADAALSERDLDDLLPTILARTRDVLDADAAALLLIQDDGSLSLLASDGVTAPAARARARRRRPRRAACWPPAGR